MKTKMCRFSSVLMFILLTSTLQAQTVGKEQGQRESQKNLEENLKNLYNPKTVSWWDSGNGFICKYTSSRGCYMIRFDKQGRYVETLEQKVWSDTVALQPAFKLSRYRSQKVTSYWEVSDVEKNGYCLEMLDSKNNISRVWIDAQGIFSAIPPAYKAKQ